MDTKRYLGQIKRLDRLIQNKLSEIYQLKTIACSITVSNEKEKVQTSAEKDRLGSTVAKIVDLENETDKLVDSFMEKRKHIISQMETLETEMYHVLFGRYVSCKTFDQIAEEIPCSRMQVNRIHGKALLEFEKRFGREYR